MPGRRNSGGARGPETSGPPALVEIVFWKALGLGGNKRGALIEVVGERFLGDLFLLIPLPERDGAPPGGNEGRLPP
jgi:hypothetical protein